MLLGEQKTENSKVCAGCGGDHVCDRGDNVQGGPPA